MNLESISDIELLAQTKSLVSDERNLTAKILEYLKEINVRELYLERGFSSLFSFCTDYLGYEASQAQRRIVACRLLSDIPQLKEQIESGALSLTAMSLAQGFFKQSKDSDSPLTINQKIDVLRNLENKSTRECERELIKQNPEIVPARLEKVRNLRDDLVEVKFVISREVLEQLQRAKELMSHNIPNGEMSKVIEETLKFYLAKKDPLKKPDMVKRAAQHVKSRSRYIPQSLKIEVRRRDHGRCQYEDPVTKRKCHSSYQVQLDHRTPYSKSGEHSLENLRLLCRNHNIHSATKVFGINKMKKYVPNLRGITSQNNLNTANDFEDSQTRSL